MIAARPAPALELAEVIWRHAPLLTALSGQQRRVLNDLAACRTAALGGHVEVCDHCQHQRVAYNSCRNRHCPKCQASACARWMEARAEELLPVEYFHVVFTLPDDFNRLCLSSPSVLYGILFDAAARTLLEVAANPKHLGARIGFLSILHTWGQNLSLHPHLHCVVPGGGLSHDGQRWVPCRPGFFLPVRILSKVPDAIRPRATHTALGFEGPSDLCPACGRGRMIKGRLLPRQPDLLILQTYWDTS